MVAITVRTQFVTNFYFPCSDRSERVMGGGSFDSTFCCTNKVIYVVKLLRYVIFPQINGLATMLKNHVRTKYAQTLPNLVECIPFMNILFYLFFFIHCVACALCYLSYAFLHLRPSWLYSDDSSIYEFRKLVTTDLRKAFIYTYVQSFYFTTTTVTTVGYGDFYPITTLERGISIFL